MSIPSNAVPELREGSQAVAPAAVSTARPFYWSVRREVWENRVIYLAPLAAAAVFLFIFLVHTAIQRYKMHGAWPSDPARLHDLLGVPYEIAAVLIMGVAFIVGIFYSLDALYGERRDRSILFWKSLPVSDLTTVLSKFTILLVFIPLLSLVITLATQLVMLLLSFVILLGSGLSLATVWSHASFPHFSLLLVYHIVTVHGLWYAPIYGWLLLVSAWGRRAPFIWAFLPPFLVCGVEKLAFNTTHFLDLLQQRLMGPDIPTPPPNSSMMDVMASITLGQFFSAPGLWIGLAIAAAFLAGAVRLRRYRGPI